MDEYSRECLAIRLGRRLNAKVVLTTLAKLFLELGTLGYLRSDNGAEITASAVRESLGGLEVGTLYIKPRSPWESGYIESSNGKLCDELLNGLLVEQWHRHPTRRGRTALWAIGPPRRRRFECQYCRTWHNFRIDTNSGGRSALACLNVRGAREHKQS
jgi:putative transposase